MEAAHDLLGHNLVAEGEDHSGDNQETVHFETDGFCVNTKIVWYELHINMVIYLCVCDVRTSG